jgi:hypothetical protein
MLLKGNYICRAMKLKLLPILILFAGCSSYKQVTKPRLFANGKTHHSWIENRRPPVYGDGLEAGCVVSGEFEVHLQSDGDSISGIIIDVNSKQAVPYAQIKIERIPDTALFIKANDSGSFHIPTVRGIRSFSVVAIGYRQIFIHPHF